MPKERVVESFKTSDLESKYWLTKEQVRGNYRQFLCIQYSDSITRRNKSGCGYRYIEISKLPNYIPNDIILDRAEMIKKNTETVG